MRGKYNKNTHKYTKVKKHAILALKFITQKCYLPFSITLLIVT
jgi:hypothetical protein